MAKKTVATLQTGKEGRSYTKVIKMVKSPKTGETVATLQTGKEGRSYTKVIKMVKSPKTGAYVFDEQMVPNEKVQDFFKK